MGRDHVLRSVQHNFLQTLSSRYSDLDGYWIWGQVVADVDGLVIDLTAPADAVYRSPLEAVVCLARERWSEQLGKQRFAPASVAPASLSIAREADARAFVNGAERRGSTLRLTASATWRGAVLSRTTLLIAAPHEPLQESRRAEGQRGWCRPVRTPAQSAVTTAELCSFTGCSRSSYTISGGDENV